MTWGTNTKIDLFMIFKMIFYLLSMKKFPGGKELLLRENYP
jgi:hypothetical protein